MRKFSERENKLISTVEQKEAELDLDFILRVAALKLIGRPIEHQLKLITETLSTIADICHQGAQSLMVEAVARDDITIDVAIDMIHHYMHTYILLQSVVHLIECAAEEDKEMGPLGAFSSTQDVTNESLEQIRMKLVRERLQARKSSKR